MRIPFSRIVVVTIVFMVLGFLAGAACGLLSLLPMWIQAAMGQNPIMGWPIAVVTAGVGTVCGAALGPIVGWLAISRAPVWRAVLEPAAGAVIGSWLPWVYTLARRSYIAPGTDTLLLCAALGALAATLRLRLKRPPERAPVVP